MLLTITDSSAAGEINNVKSHYLHKSRNENSKKYLLSDVEIAQQEIHKKYNIHLIGNLSQLNFACAR